MSGSWGREHAKNRRIGETLPSPDVTTSSAAQRFDGTRTHGAVGVPLRVEMRVGGADDKVQQAEQELPDQVDPEQHAELLQKLGIDPMTGWAASASGSASEPPRPEAHSRDPPPAEYTPDRPEQGPHDGEPATLYRDPAPASTPAPSTPGSTCSANWRRAPRDARRRGSHPRREAPATRPPSRRRGPRRERCVRIAALRRRCARLDR